MAKASMGRRSRVGFIALMGCALVTILVIAGQSLASGGRMAAQTPAWGPDIQVNPTMTDTPYHPIELNYSLAVNPSDRDNVLAGWESSDVGLVVNRYAWSTDQGVSWLRGEFSEPWQPGAMDPLGSVTVAFDGHGTGYYSSLAQGSDMQGYFVLTATTGTAWSTPVPVVIAGYEDRTGYYQGHMAVDTRMSGAYAGSLYMFWLYTDLDYPTWNYGIRARYSRDGGLTWSGNVRVTDLGNDYTYSPYGVVASDGTVYVTFEGLDDGVIVNPPKMYLARSTDGGQTWGANHLITGGPIMSIGRLDYEGHELTLVGSAFCSLIRINHYPLITVSPSDPQTVYTVWNDGRWENEVDLCGRFGRHSDIAFSRSTDGGSTWSVPVRINDDPINNGIDQFQPNIAVRQDGLVGVTWLDRRYDPDHYEYDLAYSQSTDGGMTWSANQRVSDASADPDQLWDYKGIDSVGYRRGLIYGADYVLPSWTHALSNPNPTPMPGEFYTDHGQFDTATPTSTPTTAPTNPATSSATPTRTPTRIASQTVVATSTVAASATNSPTATPLPTVCTIQFADVPPGSTFYPFVRCLACRGIVSGYECGGVGEPCPGVYFRPSNNVSRGQAAKIVSNSAGYQDSIPPDRQSFNDVPVGSTFWLFVERVALHGAIHGYECGGVGEPCPGAYFRPGNMLTRGQMAQIDAIAAEYGDTIPPDRQSFNDVPVESTFWLSIERIYLHGVVNGYPCGSEGEPCPGSYFRPGNNVTRGQTAKIAANSFFPDCEVRGR